MSAAGNKKSGFETPVVVLGAVAAILFVYVISLFLRGGFMAVQAREFDAKTYGPVNAKVLDHRGEQAAILHEKTRWLNEEQGVLCMPVADAVDRFVARHADAGQ